MLKILTSIFKTPDLKAKVLYILGIFVIFRIVAAIPLSIIDTERLQRFFSANPLFGLLNVFTGSTMENFSLVMLGLGPYITAVIIMQLMTMIFPKLKELYQREGEAGRQRFSQYGRLLTIPLSALQGFSILILLTAGTLFLMWLGELISTKGIGNGVSLLIFAGIVSGIPASIQQTIATYNSSQLPQYFGFAAVAVVVVAAVVFISEATRRLPVSYARGIRGRRLLGGASTYLPLKVNQAGVIPIIFALSILLFPNLLATFFAGSSIEWVSGTALALNRIFENRVFNRITLAGALFLGGIAVLPNIVGAAANIQTLQIGGTAVLIVVAVVLETVRQLEAQLALRQYE